MANISDAYGTISFKFLIINEKFEETNIKDNRTKEEKLAIVQKYCETLTEKTNLSDYGFSIHAIPTLDNFSEDGNIYNLRLGMSGRWNCRSNFEWLREDGFLNDELQKLNIIKNLIVEVTYDEAEICCDWLSINNHASITYNDIGIPDVQCYEGECMDANMKNLIEAGFENIVENEIECLVDQINEFINEVKISILENDFDIQDDIDYLLDACNRFK